MRRTTVYIPEDLKRDLKRVAEEHGRSEAELIRQGIRLVVKEHAPSRPRIPLFSSGDPNLAEKVEEMLDGFGER